MSEGAANASKVKLMECKSCGAHFDEMFPACPYCGTMSIKGAEAEYMDKLEDIRENMEDLTAVPVAETKKELKKQTKIILWVLGICIGLFLVFVLIEIVFGYKPTERDDKAEYMWLQENIPLLNELYEQENYEELLKTVKSAWSNNEPIEQWEHITFCDYLEYIFEEREILEKEASGQALDVKDYEKLLYLHCRAARVPDSALLQEEEKEKLLPFVEELNADYDARWNFTKEEQALLEESLEKNGGFPNYDDIRVIVEMWMERNKK